MKDKLLNMKDDIVRKITENKKISAITAIAAVIIVIGIVVAVASFGGGKSDNTSNKADSEQLKNSNVEADNNNNSTDNSGIGKDGKKDETSSGETDSSTDAQGETVTTNADNTSANAGNGNAGNNSNSNSNAQNDNQANANGGSQSGNSQAGATNTGNTSNSGSGNGNNANSNNTSNANTGNTGSNANNTTNTGNTANSNANNTTTSSSGNKSPQPTGTSSGTDTPQANQETIYNQLFDINNKVTITLDISDSELQKLQNDYKKYGNGKSPIYRRITKMTVTINNTSYEIYDVGVRMKGNTSRCDVYNNGNLDDRNLIHMRLSFDEAFDNTEYYGSEALSWSEAARKERKARTFATLDALELKWNRNFDGTYVANYYANQMYRAMGVYAQNTSLANIRFGGYNYGVYTIYEPVDKKFIKRYIPEASDSDLYKCGWSNMGASYTTNTLSSIGVETPYTSLTYDLKTNKSSSNHSSLKNLINQLNSSSSKSTFASLVDADNWVNFVAVSYFVGNPDDLRNNFNNHYVYFKNGKAVFIPYDYDRCFGIVTESNEDMTTFSPYADNTALQGSQRNPLYLNSVTGRSNNYTTEYTNALKRVAQSGWLNYSNYQKYYNIARNNYSSVAIPDSNVHVYVKPFGGSGRVHDSSKLGFSENNGYNTSVSEYMTKIINRYNEAMSKW